MTSMWNDVWVRPFEYAENIKDVLFMKEIIRECLTAYGWTGKKEKFLSISVAFKIFDHGGVVKESLDADEDR